MKNIQLYKQVESLICNLPKTLYPQSYLKRFFIIDTASLLQPLQCDIGVVYNRFTKNYEYIALELKNNNHKGVSREYTSLELWLRSNENEPDFSLYLDIICTAIGYDFYKLNAVDINGVVEELCTRVDEILTDCKNQLQLVNLRLSFNAGASVGFHTPITTKVDTHFKLDSSNKEVKCECGADKCGGKHSDWCAKYIK